MATTEAETPVLAVALSDRDRDRHFAVRRAIFVEEQGIFVGDDRDERDALPSTLHLMALVGEEVGGVVRAYPTDDAGNWQGDRLAILPGHRSGLGLLLVRFAVRSAAERGGHRMIAMVQPRNVRFFEHLGWTRDGALRLYHRVEHQPMAIAFDPAR